MPILCVGCPLGMGTRSASRALSIASADGEEPNNSFQHPWTWPVVSQVAHNHARVLIRLDCNLNFPNFLLSRLLPNTWMGHTSREPRFCIPEILAFASCRELRNSRLSERRHIGFRGHARYCFFYWLTFCSCWRLLPPSYIECRIPACAGRMLLMG